MTAYYNEFDPYAAQWLRNLVEAGHIAPGVVDERSIEDVVPSDLKGFTQCHFFAGVGVWSLALRRAGWPDTRPVWTGSCPCQPFSTAGAGSGFADARHLWPSFSWLIKQCKPPVVIGEQVASKAVEPWIDLVQADMEAMEYAFGAVPFPSAGVGAPHIRDRAYWVAERMGNTQGLRQPGKRRMQAVKSERGTSERGGSGRMADGDGDGDGRSKAGERQPKAGNDGAFGNSVNAAGEPEGRPVNGRWADADWLFCTDGRWRPVEPGTFPLANGASSRVGRLRAYGNAINAEAARIFIECVMGD